MFSPDFSSVLQKPILHTPFLPLHDVLMSVEHFMFFSSQRIKNTKNSFRTCYILMSAKVAFGFLPFGISFLADFFTFSAERL